jgi:hypothetical protein
VVTGANWPAIIVTAAIVVAVAVLALVLVATWLDRRARGGSVSGGDGGDAPIMLLDGGYDAGSGWSDCGGHGGDAGCH